MASIRPVDIILNNRGSVIAGGQPSTPLAPSRGKNVPLGPSGYVLGSNGTDLIWFPYSLVPGTVTSVDGLGVNGITVGNGPITTSGTLSIGLTHPTISPSGGNITGVIDMDAGTYSLTAPEAIGTVSSITLSSSTDLLITNPTITTVGTITADLKPSGVVAGTYSIPQITVDTKGRLTAVSAGAVNLSTQVSGNISVSNMNGGTNASSLTYWRGDGTWVNPLGSALPQALGTTASSGSSSLASRQDHIHPLPSASQVGAVAATGGSITGDLTITGNLTVTGTTTTTTSENLDVEDVNISMGNVPIPTDATATGGGVILRGTTDKTMLWANDSYNNWTFSENINVVSGRSYKINNVEVINSTTIGSSVTASSLTSVGTINSGVWNGSVIQPTFGGTGVNNGTKTITLGGNFATSGAYATTITVTGSTNVTFPTTGTLATRAGTETLTNKTLTSPSINSATINNSTIGATTPNTGAFTTLAASSLNVSGVVTASSYTGNFAVGSGSAAVPALYFSAEPSTGIFRPTAKTFGISVFGTQRFSISDTAINIGGAITGDTSTGPILVNKSLGYSVPISNNTTNVSVTFTQSNYVFTNSGASGAIVYTLPVATAGAQYGFYIKAGQQVTITAASGGYIKYGTISTSSGGSFSSSTIGNYLKILAISTSEWIVDFIVGEWDYS